MQADHVHELRLGGHDTWKNLRMLHQWTTWDLGSEQVNRDLVSDKVAVGTPIKIKTKMKWK